MSKSSVNRALVHRKLERLRVYLDELAEAAAAAPERYRRDVGLRRQAERSLELAIMAACDVNSHLVARLTGRPPKDYYSSFVQLGELGVLTTKLARRLAPAAGLRNRLQHEYDEIDDSRVHRALPRAREEFTEYTRAILTFLSLDDS